MDFLHQQIFEEANKINKSNISKHERKGLMELRNKKNIIIKEADKRRGECRSYEHKTLL